MKITITYPESWAEVKFKDYYKFYQHMEHLNPEDEDYKDDQLLASAIYLHKVPSQYFHKLPTETVLKIRINTNKLLSEIKNLPLVQTFNAFDVEYGFIPDLDNMPYGEYLDLVEYSKDYYKNVPIIMSILYRPVTVHKGKLYDIEPYNGTNDDSIEMFKEMLMMDQVFGATGFFLGLQKDLGINIAISSLVEAQKIVETSQPDPILQKHGGVISRSLRSLMDNLQKLTK